MSSTPRLLTACAGCVCLLLAQQGAAAAQTQAALPVDRRDDVGGLESSAVAAAPLLESSSCATDNACACGGSGGCAAHSGYFGGADFLLVRPHFSEAVAFASGVQTPASFETDGVSLNFDYEAAFRAFVGYRVAGGGSELRFTYWNLHNEVGLDGTVGGPGQFLVDPFGGLVGAVAIIDPSDARGQGTILMGGDRIATRGSVDVNIYDLDFASLAVLDNPGWELAWSAGARIADVDQWYDSLVTANGEFLSGGDFRAEFIGAGPRLGMEVRRVANRLSVYANAHTALLLGDYDVGSSVTPTAGFLLEQSESSTRLVPVLEAEVGVAWRICDQLMVSGGWLFQGWLDLGASGGTFGGFFVGADDANIMSFDGLTVRAELAY